MADSKVTPTAASGSGCFKEAVCIDAGRIYDSCSDKDCLEDLQVFFTDLQQPIIDRSVNVKCKSVEVVNVLMDVESIPFNRGFYSVDMTFFFNVCLNAYASPISPPTPVNGFATFSKKVILYGSEGNVKVFSSDDRTPACEGPDSRRILGNNPKATVQVVTPIVLSTRLLDCAGSSCSCPCAPQGVASLFDGDFNVIHPERIVLITLGLFTIVQMERSVQMMIPAYDFCIPDKECTCSADDPCELFKRIKFPTNEFFPPKLSEIDCDASNDRSCCGS